MGPGKQKGAACTGPAAKVGSPLSGLSFPLLSLLLLLAEHLLLQQVQSAASPSPLELQRVLSLASNFLPSQYCLLPTPVVTAFFFFFFNFSCCFSLQILCVKGILV
ncbi:hypothetical protein FKM82_028486 [Ascaphus truei]